ncbi:MAG: M23 family metallopeptidase [Candidatus Azobacteroides sp.]|nr:M23 family metallopeptidase [Candidatus Azobacteroides sp.]
MKRIIVVSLFFLLFSAVTNVSAQTIGTPPVKIPMYLSASFGELRNNHFHSGLDIKIGGKVGLPLYSFDDGYISRISVSPGGYGKALYITHPNGYTTVYGHMDGFFDEAENYVKKYQYDHETFEADLSLPENKIRVKRGQFIGYGGNTGSSGGPHLHFEVRNTQTQEALNPMPFVERYLTDSRSPQIQEIMIIPMNDDAGIVNGSRSKRKFPLVTHKKTGIKSINTGITAWGKIGVAVKAYDYMNNVNNIFGPYSIMLKVDGIQVFGSKIDHFAFDETRYLNSFVDFENWKTNGSFFMKSFVDPGNKLRIYNNLKDRGIITIDEEREYQLTYTISDYFGNTTGFDFVIRGKKEVISKPDDANTQRMEYNKDNKYTRSDLELDIPEGNLYTDIRFKYGARNSMDCLSPVYTLHQYEAAPLHGYCPLKIKISNDRLTADASKCYIARIDKNNRKIYHKSRYKNGWFETQIRDFGDYTVVSDVTPPVITPSLPDKWGINGRIICKIYDKDSGIKSYKGQIDGAFYLMEYDSKNNLLSAKLESSRIQKGTNHTFRLVVTDNCENEAEYTFEFVW